MKIEVNETAFNVEGRRSKIGPKCQFWGNNLEMRKTCEEASSGEEMIIILQLLAHTGPSLVVAENIPFTIIYLRNL